MNIDKLAHEIAMQVRPYKPISKAAARELLDDIRQGIEIYLRENPYDARVVGYPNLDMEIVVLESILANAKDQHQLTAGFAQAIKILQALAERPLNEHVPLSKSSTRAATPPCANFVMRRDTGTGSRREVLRRWSYAIGLKPFAMW